MITCPVSNKPVDVQKDGPGAFHVRSWAGRWFCLKTFPTYEEAATWREQFEFTAQPDRIEMPNGMVRFSGLDWMSEAMTPTDAETWLPKRRRAPRATASQPDEPAV